MTSEPTKRGPARWFSRKTFGRDAVAGMVIGVQSVPEGLATGLLAGVNPLAGLYGYLFGMVGAAVTTGTAMMVVQGTGAMALVVADSNLQGFGHPERALFTLTVLTGIVMIVAGILQFGRLLRFVSTPVMTGFITAIGVNIILGQVSGITGYESKLAFRPARFFDTFFHLAEWHWGTLVVGLITGGIILAFNRTRWAGIGLVIAVVLGSAIAWVMNAVLGAKVQVLSDTVKISSGLPGPVLPDINYMPLLIVPALSLALIGLVQGAGVASAVPDGNETPARARQDFIGQGVGNLAAGVFQGMPVGGSMSASMLMVQAGARTRFASLFAGAVMVVVVLVGSQAVGQVATSALAALLIVVGIASVQPGRVRSVMKTGSLPTTLMLVTFVLTVSVPVQAAVLAGVGLSIVLFVAQQSNRLIVRRLIMAKDGRMRETDPPLELGKREVVALQPYGSFFFASAPALAKHLPAITKNTSESWVIVRLRGVDQLGLAMVGVLVDYAKQLHEADSRLKVVVSEMKVAQQLRVGGLTDLIGVENVYRGSEWIGTATRKAYKDACTDRDALDSHS